MCVCVCNSVSVQSACVWMGKRVHVCGWGRGCMCVDGEEGACVWMGKRVHVCGWGRGFMCVDGEEGACAWMGKRVHVTEFLSSSSPGRGTS